MNDSNDHDLLSDTVIQLLALLLWLGLWGLIVVATVGMVWPQRLWRAITDADICTDRRQCNDDHDPWEQ